ncbi:amino acid adenylation domain-containing protein [Streptomyces ficellus]|uniref:Amino acid adenylation domain-containing protein n=1 Tax=Streptomyces ficellus TaxID=1977088 RepID=A0ABT7Z6D6_9ACTN|nr:amino acid adenylation domain-containing protein [Streptomyces ficellus]MDN3295050.1 amino acid adenylation domain-containing protein [Streptomyces ficellus]
MRLHGRRTDPPGAPVHRVFETHAKAHPGRPALTCGPVSYTYGELNERANRLAHWLLARGVGPGSVVGICLDRSPELVVTLLGALKAGAAYAPLDPSYPAERLRLMTEQLAHADLIAVSPATSALVEHCADKAVEVAGLDLDAFPATEPEVAVDGESLCYVVFTSGSTGAPKATAVRHKGWYNLLEWVTGEFGLGADSSNLMISSFGFDISQRSLMAPLFSGATLHLLPSRSFDVLMASRLIRELKVRTLHCAPSALYLLIQRDEESGGEILASLQYAFVGGEPLSVSRLESWAKNNAGSGRIVNVYGVAECTDVSSFHALTDYADYAAHGVPIGRPVNNTDLYILDEDLRSVAPGQTGEICVAGLGVGAGYLNAPALNEERFVTAPLDGGRDVAVYRTGDMGYVRDDGELMCVGRVDTQVKIRGMRIDLGEVENAVRSCQGVRDAVVLVAGGEPNGGEAHLAAFVIPEPATDGRAAELDSRALRSELLAAHPRHLVPKTFVAVPGFPLSPNGKVDRRALAHQAG